MKLISATRTCISNEKRLPKKVGDGVMLYYAAHWSRGRLIDVVRLNVIRTRVGFDNSMISIFERVDIGRIPDGYFAQPIAFASIGSGETCGGKWGERWLVEPGERLFIPAVESRIVRLKEYPAWGRIVPCVWSIRDPRLKALLQALNGRSLPRQVEALAAIADMDWEPQFVPELVTSIVNHGVRSLLSMIDGSDGLTRIKAKQLLYRISASIPQIADDAERDRLMLALGF